MIGRLIVAAGLVSAGLAVAVLSATPARALTAKQKMETCKFGADDQKLTGARAQNIPVEVHGEHRLAARKARAEAAVTAPGAATRDLPLH